MKATETLSTITITTSNSSVKEPAHSNRSENFSIGVILLIVVLILIISALLVVAVFHFFVKTKKKSKDCSESSLISIKSEVSKNSK